MSTSWFRRPGRRLGRPSRAAVLGRVVPLEDRITPADPGDDFSAAAPTGLTGVGSFADTQQIGDGANTTRDVDLYSVTVTAGQRLTAVTNAVAFGGTAMNTYLRVFNAAGTQVASNNDFNGTLYSRLTVTLPTAGTYYVGVSASGNIAYNPSTGTGTAVSTTGTYAFAVRVEAAVPWTGQGPGRITGGQTEGLTAQSNPVAGAMQAVAPHPTNPDILYAASPNGGVWKTTNATNASPTWTPLTDLESALSFYSLVFDTTDPTNNTLVAGTGHSSSIGINGNRIGLYRTTDGGASWAALTSGLPGTSDTVRGIVAQGSTIVVAMRTNGVYRSTNAGASFTKISGTTGTGLPAGGSFDLMADPINPTRVYAIATTGVYRSTDAGATWTAVTPPSSGVGGSTTNAKLAIHADATAGTNAVYVGVVTSGTLSGVYRTADSGATWDAMGVPATADAGAKVITAATNATPISVTSSAHGLATGNSVIITGGRGNTAVNGGWTVTVTGANTFTLDGSGGNGTYAASSAFWVKATPITAATNAGPIVVTSVAHGLSTGAVVDIVGAQGNTAANGYWRITKIDNDTFSLNDSTGNGDYTGGGLWGLSTSLQPHRLLPYDEEVDGSVRPQSPPADDPIRDEPGGQGSTHFSLAADPTDPNLVYIGGDRQDLPFPNAVGASNYSGRLFRGDFTRAAGDRWIPITNNFADPDGPGTGTAGTSPHADSRDLAFDAAGNLLEADDGGVYRRTNPRLSTGVWSAVIGTTLAVTEAHSASYDPVSQRFFIGNQDTGTAVQSATGSQTWTQTRQGDGAVTQIAVEGTSSVRYSSSQNQGGWNRVTYNSSGTQTASATLALRLSNVGTGLTMRTMTDDSFQFYGPYRINEAAPARLVYGSSNHLYESANRGDDMTRLTTSSVGAIQAIAYGTAGNPDILYAGSSSSTARFLVRDTAGGAVANRTSLLPSTNGTRGIVIDPDDWRSAYWLTTSGQVFRTTDAGATTGNWLDVSGNLTAALGSARSISILDGAAADLVLVGGNNGVFVMSTAAPGVWYEVGANLPNAVANDVRGYAGSNLISLGTLGRGVWSVGGTNTLFDTTAPAVPAITRLSSTPTSTTTVTYQVAFAEPVAGLAASNFSVVAGGPTGAAITAIVGGGTTWTVTVSTGTGDGTIRLDWAGPSAAVDLSGNAVAAGTVTGAAYAIDRTAPTATVAVNGGAAQRSRVDSITVTYNEVVSFTGGAASAFALAAAAGGVSVSAATSTAGGFTTVTLTFLSNTEGGGSLVDGNYRLTALAAPVKDAAGNQQAANVVAPFFRLFGDGDGSGAVDADDFIAFGTTYGLATGDAGYLPWFDQDGVGSVDADDFIAFSIRYGTAAGDLPSPPDAPPADAEPAAAFLGVYVGADDTPAPPTAVASDAPAGDGPGATLAAAAAAVAAERGDPVEAVPNVEPVFVSTASTPPAGAGPSLTTDLFIPVWDVTDDPLAGRRVGRPRL